MPMKFTLHAKQLVGTLGSYGSFHSSNNVEEGFLDFTTEKRKLGFGD